MTVTGGMIPNLEPWRVRLYAPSYTLSEAARYAGIAPATISRWYQQEGGLTGREPGQYLSYLQLVEVAFVATMRNYGLSLRRIWRARQYLADRLGCEYPFAEQRLMSDGVHLLLELPLEEGVPEEERKMIVLDEGGQLAWKRILSERYVQFEHVNGLALVWHVSTVNQKIVIDPRIAFGAPQINGVPTRTIAQRWNAGDSLDEISDGFNLEPNDVVAALHFEGVRVEAA